MESKIAVHAKLDFNDYLNAHFLYARPRNGCWWAVYVFSLLGLFFMAAVFLMSGSQVAPNSRVFAIFTLTLAILAYYYFLHPRLVIRRAFRQMKVDEVNATYLFDEKEIEVKSDDTQAVFEWQKLHRWRSNGDCLLIYLHDTYYYILPRRAFNDEQWAFVRAQLEKHVKRVG